MTGTWRQLRSLPGSVQLLVVNQFGINLGFYMLMPYLANHLSNGLGMAAWTVGLVLGVRTLSQQGLFLLGGALADRLGYKPMIIAGCALRTVGFALLGVVDTLPALLVASVATGLAGALFNPSVRAYVAADAGPKRVEAFAVFNVFYQAGILVGPLVGLALITLDFRVVCLTAAAIFSLLTLLQLRSLPPRRQEHDAERPTGAAGVLADWRTVVGNRAFLLFSLAMISSYVLSSQIYLALPLQAAHVLGSAAGDTGSSALFAVSAVVAIVGQVRLTAWARARWSSGRSVTTGLALMAAAFLPLVLTAHVSPTPPAGVGAAILALAPALVSTVLLTLGTAIAYPFEMDTIVTLSDGRLVATHYGFYNTLSGIGITLGNLATGWIWGVGMTSGWPVLVWIALTATGAVGTGALALLLRAGHLPSTVSPAVAQSTAPPAATSGATGRTK
ncbi:MDR family MFS transporter [Saccharothrix deserti]|uniref:MDR family MFS transporter n=1 Tax=Saccharothrix deserti TaxID=2593674 RepID=UPI00131DD0FB|nr:MFS transporter [Saccharothrix deserti]